MDSQRSRYILWIRIFTLTLVHFINKFVIFSIINVSPFVIHFYFPHVTSSEIGEYSGYFFCSFSIGSMIGNFLWSKAADYFGRRMVLYVGLINIAIWCVMTGLTFSFVWTLCALFLLGVLNGNMSVGFTIMTEICTDKEQALGFSALGFSEGGGRLVGPVLIGFLSCIAYKYKYFSSSIFEEFPFLLPYLFPCLCCFVAFIGILLVIPETLHWHDSKSRVLTKQEFGDQNSETNPLLKYQKPTSKILKFGVDVTKLIQKLKNFSTVTGSLLQKLRSLQNVDTNVWISTILLVVTGASVSTVSQVIPLLYVTDYEHGGYNFNSDDISILYMFPSIIEVIYQFLLYPKIANKIGFKKTYQMGALLSAAGALMLPCVTLITGPRIFLSPIQEIDTSLISNHSFTTDTLVNFTTTSLNDSIILSTEKGYDDMDYIRGSRDRTNISGAINYCWMPPESNSTDVNLKPGPISIEIWANLVVAVCLVVLGRMTCYTSSAVMLANSCLAKDVSTANGISQSLLAFMQSTIPISVTILFAWSENNGFQWPFNFHLVFIIIALVTLASGFLSTILSDSVNHKLEDIQNNVR